METPLFDTIFLMGTSALPYGTDLFLTMASEKSKFSKNLLKILTSLFRSNSCAAYFGISDFFIELITAEGKRSGFCNICLRYASKLKEHLRYGHSLSQSLANIHETFFSNSSYFPMPRAFKTLESFNESLRKNTTLESQTKNKPIPVIKPLCAQEVAYAKSRLSSPNSKICKKCGNSVLSTCYKSHMRSHLHNEIVKCLTCGVQIQRSQYPKHDQVCNSLNY